MDTIWICIWSYRHSSKTLYTGAATSIDFPNLVIKTDFTLE